MAVRALRTYAEVKRPPRSSRGELKRKQILDAAARVLARRGYVSTQLSEIASEAHTHPGSLYYHFDSREELIEEVLLEGVRLLFARTRAIVDEMPPESTPMERLCVAIRAHLKYALVESAYALAAARSGGQLPEDMWKRINAKFRLYGKFVDDLIQAAMKSGEIDATLNRSALRMLIIGAANYTPEWYHRSGPLSVDQISDLLIRLMVSGVGNDSSRSVSLK
jgi:TetR/AcrR family transcriptional regulator, cholesterol catabolism regulator